jgi:hypothetical protein
LALQDQINRRSRLSEDRAILHIQDVRNPSSAFFGALFQCMKKLEQPAVVLSADQRIREVFRGILPPVGGLPWRFFAEESKAVEYVRNRKGRRGAF